MSKYRGTDEFQKDMKDFEFRIKKLRAEYNQYLAGVLKAPPTFSVAMIRKVIRKYAGDRSLKGIQRFRYYNLVAKFNTMIEMYNRRIRNIEDGKQTTFSYIKDGNDVLNKVKEKTKSMGPPPVDKGHVISDTNKQQTTMKNMYSKWNEYSSYSQNNSMKMDFNQFSRIINQKTKQLIESKGCKAVRYKLTLQDGKIKIQAKPIK